MLERPEAAISSPCVNDAGTVASRPPRHSLHSVNRPFSCPPGVRALYPDRQREPKVASKMAKQDVK